MHITDEQMQQLLPTTRPYCAFHFTPGPRLDQPEAQQIQWEHVRYLLQMRAEGKLAIVGPVMADGPVMGIGILRTGDPDEARAWLDQDPNVRAGRLLYEVYQIMSFPGDSL